jgi:hypothetical protein
MHVTIRQYKTDSPKEVTKIVNEGFFPLITKVTGFVAYYGAETGENSWASVSVFETPAGAEESNRVAAEFVKNNPNLARLIKSKPEVIAGSVGAHKTK